MKEAIKSLMGKLDPKQLEKRLPRKSTYDRFQRARDLLIGIVDELSDSEPIPPALLRRMEEVSEIFDGIFDELHPSTEIASRSCVNRISHWVLGGHVERSIYLAGVAQGKKLKEPYNTQIQLLPANACLLRYRQINCIEAELTASDLDISELETSSLIIQLKASLLYQMQSFTRDAFSSSDGHPMAIYMMAISELISGRAAEEQGDSKVAESSYKSAEHLILGMPEPISGDHFMHIQWHMMNYDEFKTFQRLSERFGSITSRLENLAKKATAIRDSGTVNVPKQYYDVTPYLVVGARAASIVALVAAGAQIAGSSWEAIDEAVRGIWGAAVEGVPGIDSNEATKIALHGGGVSRELLFTTLSSHGGGIA